MRQIRTRNSLKVVTPPVSYPVTVDEVKLWLRIDGNNEDDLLLSCIMAATEMAERYTRRAFITQTLRFTVDRPPSRFNDGYFMDGTYDVAVTEINPMPDKIEIPRPPLISLTSVKTYGRDNSVSTFDSSNYYLDADGNRIVLNTGAIWPSNLRDYGALEVNYIAGYGNAATVPEGIKTAIKMHVSSMYESRNACGDIPDACLCMLDKYRMVDRLSYNG